jgi:hypothetical protein
MVIERGQVVTNGSTRVTRLMETLICRDRDVVPVGLVIAIIYCEWATFWKKVLWM